MLNVLNFIGTMLAGIAIAVNVTTITATVPARLGWKLTFAGFTGAWAACIVVFGAAGLFSDPKIRFGTFFFPLVVSAAVILAFPSVRRALLAIPMPLLIGVNLTRVFGWLFLALAFAGRLSGPFPISAGWGDIITGAFAIPVAYLAARTIITGKTLVAIAVWNTFGILDLVNALVLGLITTNGLPLQLLHVGVGAAGMGTLPWIFVPAFLVPFYLVAHAIVFAQLRMRASAAVFNERQTISGTY